MAEFALLEAVSAAPREEWNALVADGSPFLEWEWLAALEQAGCVGEKSGWWPRPLVLREAGRLVAACPLYIKAHSAGEFVFDQGFAAAAARAGLAYYPKLLVGVPFTPVGGARFLCAEHERARRVPELATALRELCARGEFSGVHINFCREDEHAALVQEGWLSRVGIQYHFKNRGFKTFEDYLMSLRSKRRNQVRREQRALGEQRVTIARLTGGAIDDEMLATMYRLYLQTIRENPWGRQYLNRAFFEALGVGFRKRLCFVAARCEGRVVAGTVNVQKGDVLYGRYWGAFQNLRHLHFNVCYYAGIAQCIEHGLARFEPGAGGEYKQLRGFDAAPTWSCHHFAHPRLREAVAAYLAQERAQAGRAIEWQHAHSANRPARDEASRCGGPHGRGGDATPSRARDA